MNFMRYSRLILGLFLIIYGQSALAMKSEIASSLVDSDDEGFQQFLQNQQLQPSPQAVAAQRDAEQKAAQTYEQKQLELQVLHTPHADFMSDDEQQRQVKMSLIQMLMNLAHTNPQAFHQIATQQQHLLITAGLLPQPVAQQQAINAVPRIEQSIAQQQPVNIVGQIRQPVATAEREGKNPVTSCVLCRSLLPISSEADINKYHEEGKSITCQTLLGKSCKEKSKPTPLIASKNNTAERRLIRSRSAPEQITVQSKDKKPKKKSKPKTPKESKKQIVITCCTHRCGITFSVSPHALQLTLEDLANAQPSRTKDQLKCTDFGYECSLHLTCKTCGSLFSIPKKYQPEFLTHQQRENFTCAFITWENMSDKEKGQRNRCPLMKEVQEPVRKKRKTS